MNEYQFTNDWFSGNIPNWLNLLANLPERDPENGRKFLEIGSFEGRSTVWTIENMMQKGDYILCIDTWKGGEEHASEDMDCVYDRFLNNIGLAFDETGVAADYARGLSTEIIAREIGLCFKYPSMYDFIYIDGSHVAKDVLTDACMAWQILKPQGIMVFDDYLWGIPRDVLHRPKPAIDAFTTIFAEEAGIISIGYQVAVKKMV